MKDDEGMGVEYKSRSYSEDFDQDMIIYMKLMKKSRKKPTWRTVK